MGLIHWRSGTRSENRGHQAIFIIAQNRELLVSRRTSWASPQVLLHFAASGSVKLAVGIFGEHGIGHEDPARPPDAGERGIGFFRLVTES